MLVNLFRSLHDGMKTEIMVDGTTTPEIEVTNGLRQGCTIALTLFNLYFNFVTELWHKKSQPFGLTKKWREAGGGENKEAFEDHCHRASICR